MTKTLLIVVTALLLVPAAFADGSGGGGAAAACKALQKSAPDMFGPGKTYRNLGACVSAKAQQAGQNTANAAKQCKTEQADPNFASTHGGKTFSDFYGTNPNKKNAFGKCVSGKAKAAAGGQNSSQLNAAKKCKAEQADPSFASTHGGKTFSDFYGTNPNKKNAFGKCVSSKSKTKTDD